MKAVVQRPLMSLVGILVLGVLLAWPGIEVRSARSSPPSPPTGPPAAAASAPMPEAAVIVATVQTDDNDYYPGQNVVITGSGWQVGEVVSLVLHEEPPIDPDVTLYATADPSGNIFNNEFYTDWFDVGVTFTLTATGLNSGSTAQTTFTDASANLDQCTNGGVNDPPEQCKHFSNAGNWVNGDSNGSK